MPLSRTAHEHPHIRQATQDDRQSIESIVRAAYAPYVAAIGKPPAPMHADYANLIARGHVYVLAKESTICGVLVLIPEAQALLLDNVAVDPDVQHQGYGGLLMDFAEAFAVSAGYAQIRLYTNESMTRNIALYSRRGYRETHRAEEQGFRRVYMAKMLPAA